MPLVVELVDDGVQLVALCGIVGPVWAAKVLEAIGRPVPVRSVIFEAESLVGQEDWQS